MFPGYMNDMLSQARCGHCNAPQTVANIQMVGIRRPEEFEAFYGEPVFVIVMGCANCGQWTDHTMRRPRAEAIEGCISFIKLIEQECKGKKPPLNIPGLDRKSRPASTPTASPDPVKRDADAANNSHPRPSLRENQPNTPPTRREIQAFLLRLRNTSFKRSTKSFKTWMKDFGNDPEKPVDGGG